MIRFAACLLIVLGAAAASAQEPAVPWLTDPARGEHAMREQQRPGLFYFYNFRARPCHEMQTTTFEDPEVQDLMAQFVCVAIHQPDHMDLFRERFGLFKVPSVILLSPDGREIDRAVGMKDAVEFATYLDRILETRDRSLQPFADMALDLTVPRENAEPVQFAVRAPAAGSVHLVGDFNDWRTDANPMRRDNEGAWHFTAHLSRGAYEYKFHIDGEYHTDPANPLAKANPFGSLNSILLVKDPYQSPIVAGPDATFVLYNAEASNISVAGTFNGWQPFTMYRHPTEPGMWGVTYQGLSPGRYHYKYLVDGEWINDPENYHVVLDPEGNANNTFVIGYSPGS